MAGIERQLVGHRVIGLDTSIFIYHLEAHPRYLPLTTLLLKSVQAGERQAVVSTVALMELTVHPWRLDQPEVARQYEALLVNFPHVQMADVTRDVARRAAQLRAGYQIRPADALQVATAIVHGATAFVTNDKGLTRLDEVLTILVLDAFVTD